MLKGGSLDDKSMIKSPSIEWEDRIPPGQRVVENWPVLHQGHVPDMDVSKWSFKIFGLIENKVELNYEKFISLPRMRVLSDVHCVTGWTMLNNIWEGVTAKTIKSHSKILSNATHVMVHGAGGFTTNLPIKEFLEPDVIFAIKRNNKEISPEHGYPVRLVVPRLYFWKSAKWVTGLEFMDEDRPGFWESHGYHMRGDPWKEERYG